MLIHEKIRQAAEVLAELDIDCWLTFVRETDVMADPSLVFLGPPHLTWHSAFIVCRDGSSRAIVGRQDVPTVEDLGAWDRVDGFVTGIRDPLQSFLRQLDPRSIALNFSESSEICDGLSHGMFLTLHRLLDEIGMADRIVSAEPVVSALRERKTATEIEAIRTAIRHTQELFAEVAGFIRPGRSEREIADFLRTGAAERGLGTAWHPSICPGVFTGPDSAGAHYAPTDRKVAPGHVLNIDFGVKADSYCSDLQRTFYVLAGGESGPPSEVQRGFDTIVAVIEAARLAMRPGSHGVEIDAVARRIVTEAGYDEFPHGLGHQVGRFAHDGTALLGPAWEKYATKPFRPIEPGMVFTIEPRLTVPGRGVCTVEEMVLVTEDGCEWLSTPQRELIVVR